MHSHVNCDFMVDHRTNDVVNGLTSLVYAERCLCSFLYDLKPVLVELHAPQNTDELFGTASPSSADASGILARRDSERIFRESTGEYRRGQLLAPY